MGKSIFAIITFVAALAIFLLYTKPAYSAVGDQQVVIAGYQEALTSAAQLDALKQQLLTRFNAYDPNQVSRLTTMVPDSVNNIGLILDVNNIATSHGMALENVNVAAPPTTANQGALGAVQTAGIYDSLTLDFTTYGTYQNFQSFMLDLERSLRVVDVVTLNVSQQSATASNQYRYDITIKTYWLK